MIATAYRKQLTAVQYSVGSIGRVSYRQAGTVQVSTRYSVWNTSLERPSQICLAVRTDRQDMVQYRYGMITLRNETSRSIVCWPKVFNGLLLGTGTASIAADPKALPSQVQGEDALLLLVLTLALP